MSKRITIEELQSYLWNSAVLLRTNIDAGAYKQYIFPLQLMVPVPPMDLQEQFAAFVRQSDKSKFELEQALAELTATYKRIIAENLG